MNKQHITYLCVFLILWSCGDQKNKDHQQSNQTEEAHIETETSPGTYYAVLRPVNFHANGYIPYGSATLSINQEEFKIHILIDDDQAVVHPQFLYSGTRCPSPQDDTNKDGFIDYSEIQNVVKDPLIPFDEDINSQEAGKGQFPQGPAMTYKKQASLAKLKADLPQKFGPGGRVILVYGTSPHPNLPPTLSSNEEGVAPHLVLPILCGILQRNQTEIDQIPALDFN